MSTSMKTIMLLKKRELERKLSRSTPENLRPPHLTPTTILCLKSLMLSLNLRSSWRCLRKLLPRDWLVRFTVGSSWTGFPDKLHNGCIWSRIASGGSKFDFLTNMNSLLHFDWHGSNWTTLMHWLLFNPFNFWTRSE